MAMIYPINSVSNHQVMNDLKTDYNTPWKEALQDYFPAFLSLCLPKLHNLIDWSQPVLSLDRELQQITLAVDSGKVTADKLFQVWLHSEENIWILVHIEVQNQEETGFAKRMYQYHYRAFDLYGSQIVSLAILGDQREAWRPNSFGYELGGCRLSLEFPMVKLIDYETQWEQLETSQNPFSVIIMAHLRTKSTTDNPEAREQWKWRIVQGLYEREYSKDEIIRLFQFVDRMMTLSEALQHRFERKVLDFEENKKMPLLSHLEKRGIEQGIEQSRKYLQETLVRIVQKRFSQCSPSLIKKIHQIQDIPQLQQLIEDAIEVTSIEDFEENLSSMLLEN